ncbi:MAG: glycosyltransferase [Planctomycetes bacterium]|nr:glycosyltransferase [Planctomycetota bacterium]
MISYLLPTRDRPDRLAATLRAIGALSEPRHAAHDDAEIVVVDDASVEPVRAPKRVGALPVRVIRLDEPRGAAARNTGARAARGSWVVMLDDDSWPLDHGHLEAIADAAPEVAAIGAEIVLGGGRREDGGLPEVFVGCGAVVRRSAFLDVGGYDPTFHYYAEEYDLCAKLLLAGWHVVHDWRFRVRHEKVAEGRDMNVILRRLVRNNGWVMQRYAPDHERAEALEHVIGRYGRIARREHASFGYEQGLDELMSTLDEQPRTPMGRALWERFTGRAAARAALRREGLPPGASVAVVDEGKNAGEVRLALADLGRGTIVDEPTAELLIVGTLSPGPMVDAWQRRRRRGAGRQRVLTPWRPKGRAFDAGR